MQSYPFASTNISLRYLCTLSMRMRGLKLSAILLFRAIETRKYITISSKYKQRTCAIILHNFLHEPEHLCTLPNYINHSFYLRMMLVIMELWNKAQKGR
jgi:hypothetical protein